MILLLCQLDLDDIKWDLGRFGKIHVRMGEGARGRVCLCGAL